MRKLGLLIAALAALATLAASSHAVQASVIYTYTAPLLFSNEPGGNNSTLTSWASNNSTSFAKSASDLIRRSTL
jgi:uncharacterized protein involved in exopolysaccharide biosynthesis